MTDPAASIKSILSGRVPLTPDIEYEDFASSKSSDSMSRLDDGQEPRSMSSVSSIDAVSRSVAHMAPHGTPVKRSNVEVDSSRCSTDTEGDQTTETNVQDSESFNVIGTDYSFSSSEPISRPLSRSSLNSCVSTTATKDGVEGRRLHKKGPSTYSSNIIQNMLLTQKSQARSPTPDVAQPSLVPPFTWLRDEKIAPTYSDTNDSSTSLKTTRAEADGEYGQGGKASNSVSNMSKSLPSVTLKEKIEMLDDRDRHGTSSGLS